MILALQPLLIPTVVGRGYTLTAKRPFAGDFEPVAPGDTRLFAFDFSKLLEPGDEIYDAIGSVSIYLPEAEAALVPSIIQAAPIIFGNVVMQNLGGSPGFLDRVTYCWTMAVKTGYGETLSTDGHVFCVPIC